jgi:hypothetical protein
VKHTLEDLHQQAQRTRDAYDHALAMLNLSLCALGAILIALTAVLILA